jgi:uncharacterized membrane protein
MTSSCVPKILHAHTFYTQNSNLIEKKILTNFTITIFMITFIIIIIIMINMFIILSTHKMYNKLHLDDIFRLFLLLFLPF